jgi:hypothetical protein
VFIAPPKFVQTERQIYAWLISAFAMNQNIAIRRLTRPQTIPEKGNMIFCGLALFVLRSSDHPLFALLTVHILPNSNSNVKHYFVTGGRIFGGAGIAHWLPIFLAPRIRP